MNYEPGSTCTVNGNCDWSQDEDRRAFMYRECVIVKRCKSGLLQVALAADPKRTNSFAEYNLGEWSPTTLDRLHRAFGGRGRLSPEAEAEIKAALEAEWARVKAEEQDYVDGERSRDEHDEEDTK